MKITLFQFGKTHLSFVDEGCVLFTKRLKHYVKFDTITLELPPKQRSADGDLVKKSEAALLLKKIQPNDYVILLDEKGKNYSSRQFAATLQTLANTHASCVFVIGGAFGFADEVYARANAQLSLSSMTFSHQVIRVLFLEQLYRAFTIIKGEPYHND
ncbi:MAG: 23S rRNA (pseudouridine(1915)-N(3))-methyltransferase RlmH [Bacteroidia bacterium]|jgi:23S rRNA (pseudouridine1915-N3)-methyltransferase|nr:23S rRNA (pseudouridine(1915)-N(3))-methyltransferase RlmH [Bacteroidia bacterium]